MRDDETGTWWQQVSGKAISGPLSGRALEPVSMDELTFDLWRTESPVGTVIMPDPAYQKKYEKATWEKDYENLPVVLTFSHTPLKMRDIVIGIELNGVARAYPLNLVLRESPIQDEVGGVPVLIAVGPDGKSVRAFRSELNGTRVELFKRVDAQGWSLLDPSSHAEWNFQGCPSTKMPGASCLAGVPIMKDYWFDWRQYHPATTVYLH